MASRSSRAGSHQRAERHVCGCAFSCVRADIARAELQLQVSRHAAPACSGKLELLRRRRARRPARPPRRPWALREPQAQLVLLQSRAGQRCLSRTGIRAAGADGCARAWGGARCSAHARRQTTTTLSCGGRTPSSARSTWTSFRCASREPAGASTRASPCTRARCTSARRRPACTVCGASAPRPQSTQLILPSVGPVSQRRHRNAWSTAAAGPPLAKFIFKYRPLRTHPARRS
jgi:hypothetical protein